MAVKRSLWSLTLLPGERTPLFVQRDFCLTNAALGEDLRAENGRTVVKVTHQPLPPSLFDDDSEESDEDEETEEEFELDVEEGFKLTPKPKVNGDANEEDDEDEDDEEDDEVDLKKIAGDADLSEDSEGDSDYDDEDDEFEQTNVLCSLLAGKVEQATLNLMFCEGDVVIFEATGENSVHLMGNYVIQPDPDLSDSEYDSDELFDGPDDFDEIYADEDDSMGDDIDAEATIEELVEKPVVAKSIAKDAKPAKVKAEAPEASKKRKAEQVESPAPKAEAGTDGLSKSQRKKLAKKAKLEAEGKPAPAAATNGTAKGGDKQKKTTLPSGLIIEDVKVGEGPVAKSGKRLGMRYIGKLENGKQFDANTSGKPFSFRLGAGEVIRGWDEGLSGMAVGGERRLTIPAALAYGSQNLPGIPKNSTLKFDVKLVSVG